MRKMLVIATAAVAVTLGGAAANAANPNVPAWSPYAIMGYGAAPAAIKPGPMIWGRAADTNASPGSAPVPSRYTLHNPEGPLNDYYKGVGLSDDRNDCNNGCALSNGG